VFTRSNLGESKEHAFPLGTTRPAIFSGMCLWLVIHFNEISEIKLSAGRKEDLVTQK
jgi:hypothetical protein